MSQNNGINMKQMTKEMGLAMDIKNPDLSFLKGMIAHHEGAISMALEELHKGGSPAVIRIARKIVQEQRTQIREMKRLIKTVKR